MDVRFLTTTDGGLLEGVRQTLRDAERALIFVAFTHEAGVRLIQQELEELHERKREVRLVSTTVFGTTTPGALTLAQRLGVTVRKYDPSRGTFHAKVYMGIGRNGEAQAVIGSANLTAGLATNVEVAMHVRGSLRDAPLKSAWEWAEERWADPVVEQWSPPDARGIAFADAFDADLYAALKAEISRNPVFETLSTGARNVVRDLTSTQLLVETDRTLATSTPPQPVPAWMLNVAWEYLKTHGSLSNDYLLNTLRIHRSSAVCALLARLPGIEGYKDGRRIGIRHRA